MLKLLSKKPIIILLFIPLIITSIWFRNGLIHGGGEEGVLFYNPQKALQLSSSVWAEFITGSSIAIWLPKSPVIYLAFIFQKIGLPPVVFQMIFFYFLMEIGILSVYFLTSNLLEKNGKSISLIAALFYLFNPFSFSQIWGRSLSTQYFAFSFLPLALLLFYLGIKRRKYIFGILIALISAAMATSYEFLTFIIVFWLVLLIFLVTYVVVSKNKTREMYFGVTFIVLTFVLWCLFNCWWLIPLLTSFGGAYSGNSSLGADNVGSLLGVSRSFTPDVIVRLLHKGYFFDSTAFSQIYSTILFQVISFIPLFFVVFGLFKILRNKEVIKFSFFILLLFIGLAVSLGANPPLGWLFVWFFKHITPLQAFRNPFEKFGLVYALGYSVIFAYGLIYFSAEKKFKNFIIVLVVILTCGIYAWPMWTGRVIAGPDKKIGLDIPTYYNDLRDFLKDKTGDYRLLMTPIWSGDGAYYQWNTGGRYQGSDPMLYMLDQPVISNGARGPFYDFIANIRKYMDRMDVVSTLSLLRTKFLIDRQDAIMITDTEKNQYQSLTSKIYPPQGIENSHKSICQNMAADSKANGLAWVICHIPKENSDLSKIRYLHIKIKTSLPAKVEVALRDTKSIRVVWHGRVDSDYRTGTNDWQYITLPLNIPSENDPTMDLSKADILEVWAFLKDQSEKSVDKIEISEIKLDPGTAKDINEFRKVAEFGKLVVFEPTYFNPPPEFGLLSEIDQVSNFTQLFEETSKRRNLTDKLGFILDSQNTEKTLQILPKQTNMQIIDKNKISNTRYWLKVSEASEGGLLLLSKTFDPGWKVIPGVDKEILSGNIFDDLKILKMGVLPEDQHFLVNGYANLWKIDGKDNQYAILFMPQVVSDIATKASVFSIILVLGITLVFKSSRFFLRR